MLASSTDRHNTLVHPGTMKPGHYPTACSWFGFDPQMPHNVHTEILLDAAPADVDQARVALKRCMVVRFLGVFPQGESISGDLVDTKIGNSWVQTH
jgi:hypothetical protein